ncbi:MAG: arylsulfotransferase family protein [Pseudomonadota bacterium]
MKWIERLITLFSLVLLVSATSFAGGFLFRELRIAPTQEVLTLKSQLGQWRRTGLWGDEDEFPRTNLAPVATPVRVVNPEAFHPGYRVVTGADPVFGYSVRLIDETGSIAHVWPLKEEITPRTHGLVALPDGSLVLVTSGGPTGDSGTIARVDACGDRIWQNHGQYHHQVHLSDDGSLWTWFSPAHHNGHFQSMVQVDPTTGAVLRDLSLNDVASASRRNALILRIPDGFDFRHRASLPSDIAADIWHPNDVEPLPAEMADAFENFEAGDLLISLRNIDLVAVIDPETLDIKWWQSGPWSRQHDPDFMADGTIEVYDNATSFGRSSIVTVDPVTGETWRRHPSDSHHWYSKSQGMHARLPNGNSLITVPWEGRVIELDADGELVFEHRFMVSDAQTGRSSNALWLPLGYFETFPSCGDQLHASRR